MRKCPECGGVLELYVTSVMQKTYVVRDGDFVELTEADGETMVWEAPSRLLCQNCDMAFGYQYEYNEDGLQLRNITPVVRDE